MGLAASSRLLSLLASLRSALLANPASTCYKKAVLSELGLSNNLQGLQQNSISNWRHGEVKG